MELGQPIELGNAILELRPNFASVSVVHDDGTYFRAVPRDLIKHYLRGMLQRAGPDLDALNEISAQAHKFIAKYARGNCVARWADVVLDFPELRDVPPKDAIELVLENGAFKFVAGQACTADPVIVRYGDKLKHVNTLPCGLRLYVRVPGDEPGGAHAVLVDPVTFEYRNIIHHRCDPSFAYYVERPNCHFLTSALNDYGVPLSRNMPEELGYLGLSEYRRRFYMI